MNHGVRLYLGLRLRLIILMNGGILVGLQFRLRAARCSRTKTTTSRIGRLGPAELRPRPGKRVGTVVESPPGNSAGGPAAGSTRRESDTAGPEPVVGFEDTACW